MLLIGICLFPQCPPSFWPVVTQLNTFKCNIIQLLIQDKYLNVTDITL